LVNGKISTGRKYMAANCEGSRSPPRAVELRKKKEERKKRKVCSCAQSSAYTKWPVPSLVEEETLA
jgi:hypothetical protein